jgi:RNA polymerase sigma factor (sigma-70 family)
VTDRIDGTEQNSRLAAAIDALPPELREVIQLCDLQRLTHHEAASRLDMSVRTLRRRLATARSQIREVLSSELPAPRFRQVATVPQGRDVP